MNNDHPNDLLGKLYGGGGAPPERTFPTLAGFPYPLTIIPKILNPGGFSEKSLDPGSLLTYDHGECPVDAVAAYFMFIAASPRPPFPLPSVRTFVFRFQ